MQLVLGKYFGALILVIIAILPTLLYVYTISKLGNPEGNLDMGSIMGSYIGLLFLAAAYVAIGLFASTLSDNQIVAFIVAVFILASRLLGESPARIVAGDLGMERVLKPWQRKLAARVVSRASANRTSARRRLASSSPRYA